MRKTLLLPGLCLLFCTSVRGIQLWGDDLDGTDMENQDYYYDYSFDGHSYDGIEDELIGHGHIRDSEEEKILKMALLQTLVEDVADALRAIASETVAGTSENVADLKRRIKFGRIGRHKLKPIKFPFSWPKKPKVPLPEVGIGIETEIVVPTSQESSEHEE